MKKLLLIVTLAALLLVSCATTVSVDYINPSEINMGSYRNIAIASTVPYRAMRNPSVFVRAADSAAERNTFVTSSYSRSLADTVASYATDRLVSTLSSSGFFNVTPPSVTDALLDYAALGNDITSELAKRNIDAVIIPKITAMGVDEYVSSEQYLVNDPVKKDEHGNPVKVPAWRYYLTQSAYLDYSYTIIDARTLQVYAVKNFSDKREDVSQISEYGIYSPDVKGFFNSMINGFQRYILLQLVPQRQSASLSLMSNKPKIKSLEGAYDAAKNGYTDIARELFLSEYEASGHIPSGYNAALLTASMGDMDEAIALLEEMNYRTSSDDVRGLLTGLKDIKARDEEAMRQIEGTSVYDGSLVTQGKNIFQVVMGG